MRDVAALLDVSYETVRDWIRFNGLPHIKVGQLVRIEACDLDEFLAARKRIRS